MYNYQYKYPSGDIFTDEEKQFIIELCSSLLDSEIIRNENTPLEPDLNFLLNTTREDFGEIENEQLTKELEITKSIILKLKR